MDKCVVTLWALWKPILLYCSTAVLVNKTHSDVHEKAHSAPKQTCITNFLKCRSQCLPKTTKEYTAWTDSLWVDSVPDFTQNSSVRHKQARQTLPPTGRPKNKEAHKQTRPPTDRPSHKQIHPYTWPLSGSPDNKQANPLAGQTTGRPNSKQGYPQTGLPTKQAKPQIDPTNRTTNRQAKH